MLAETPPARGDKMAEEDAAKESPDPGDLSTFGAAVRGAPREREFAVVSEINDMAELN